MADSTDIFWPGSLPAPNQQPKQTLKNQNIQTQMESSRIRSRRTSLAPRELIQLSWRFTGDQYATFETFFKSTLLNGSFAFQLPLQGHGGFIERKVAFVDATYQFTRNDNLFTVTASVEALETEDYS